MPPAKPLNVFKSSISSSRPSKSSSTPPSLRKPPTETSPTATKADEDDDEDDYMSLTFPEPTSTKTETSIQRIARLKREAEARSRPKSKAELAAEEKRKREEALARNLLDDTTDVGSSNKGLSMMKKMGFKIGEGLGKSAPPQSEDSKKEDLEKRLTEPLRPVVKETRSGIGHDEHVKRKLASTFGDEPAAKRVQVSDTDYRSRLNAENQARRQEGQYYACQKVCERLTAEENDDSGGSTRKKGEVKFEEIRNTPVVWRGLLWHRARRELDAKIRHDVMTSGVSRITELKGYTADVEMDADDKVAFGLDGRDGKGRKVIEEGSGKVSTEEVVLEEEWEDPELEKFEAKEPGEKLIEILEFMRERWRYCFWCKSRYPDEAMEGCPGINEDDHD